jgi:ferric-dicitrate binding protein FerR (iron transport regulator)
MSKRDDYLEEKLSEHEMGAESRNYLLGEIDSGEETILVNMANTIRDLEHPEQDYETVQSEKRKIISAARERFPVKLGIRRVLNGRFKGQWLFASAVAGAALVLLMAFVLAAGVGLYFAGPSGAQAATLVDGTGELEVSDTGLSGDWHSISSGEIVKSGQRLRTGADSGVTLVFFEGSQATLGSNTDLVLSTIDGDWGNELQVELIQNGGETDHQVIPLQGEKASYQVLTPSGSATVKGTSFSVLVDDTGLSLFSVDTGEVLVINEGGETFVSAGQGLVTDLGKPMESPTFLFTLQGELQDNIGPTWVVDGVDIIIRDGTRIYGDPKEGDIVLVNGHITKDNDWVAHTIDSPFSDGKGGTFTGIVTAVGTGELEINGISFVWDGQPPVEVGDKVRVTFVITDGNWVIENLFPLESKDYPDDDDNGDDEPEIEAELFFYPEKNKVQACEVETDAAREFITTLNFVKIDNSQPSIDVLLDYAITEGEEFVAEVILSANDAVLTPESVVTVVDGTPVNIKVKIIIKPEYVQLPPEEEIKVKVISIDPDSKESISNYFVVKWECDEELPDDDDDDDEKDGNYCTTDAIHPHAAQLEAAYSDLAGYGATYENIMEWFCEFNLGFGEIEQAFKLFRLYREELLLLDPTYEIQDIIDMRLTGLGWGQVKKAVASLASDALPDTDVEPGAKKEPPGKSKSEEAKSKEKPNKKKKDD